MRKILLHVGCGSKSNKVPPEFVSHKEVRLDVSRAVEPDILSSIVAMPMVEDGFADAIFASHVLEHLYAHEVAQALAEFFRVLKPGGLVSIHVPDLQSIGGRLALGEADCGLYATASMGFITPLDMLYGHRGQVGTGNLYMAHKTGFTAPVLSGYLRRAGFDSITTDRDTQFELKARAVKPEG